MGRAIHRLSVKEIERRRDVAALCDGGGLYLMRSGNAAASWVFRFARQGKSHDLGLGPHPEITLNEARDKAANSGETWRTASTFWMRASGNAP